MRWIITILLASSLFAQTSRPANIVTTDPSKTNTFAGPIISPSGNVCLLNGAVYVGGQCSATWGGGDIGAQINTAIASLGNTGGRIHVIAGTYAYSTPIVIVGNSKPITLDCDAGSAGGVGTITGPTVLNYTANTGTALTYAESLGGQIIGCTLAGPGSSSSAIGLLVGGPTLSNSTIQGTFSFNNISNFGVGLQFGFNSYIDTFINNDIHDNGPNGGDNNIYAPAAVNGSFGENVTFIGGEVQNNTTTQYSTICVNIQGTADVKFYGVSFDQCGITINAPGTGIFDFFADHFENPGAITSSPFVTIGSLCITCTVNFYGGIFYEDGVSSRTEFILETSNQASNGNSVSIEGTSFTSQEATVVVNARGGGGFATCCQRASVRDYLTGTNITGAFAGSWLGTIFEEAGTEVLGGQGLLTLNRAQVAGNSPACTFSSGGGTSPSCALQTGSTDTAGTIIATTGSGSPSGAGTITLTFSAAFGTNTPVCIYQGSDGGAGKWTDLPVFKDKTPSTASDLFTWTNQPAASGANTIAVPTALSTATAYWINYHCWGK